MMKAYHSIFSSAPSANKGEVYDLRNETDESETVDSSSGDSQDVVEIVEKKDALECPICFEIIASGEAAPSSTGKYVHPVLII